MKIRLASALSLLIFPVWLGAAEYFVSKRGDDSSDGSSREKAFLTIQKGLDALAAGDTLTIGPGEYFGATKRTNLGSQEVETVIRAEIPGTVLLRGDVPVSQFKKVDGFQFVYVADFSGDVQMVNVIDTLERFQRMPSIGQLEYVPGCYFYDAENKKLYISNLDFLPPESHSYTVSVTPQCGMALLSPQRVVVEGLAATGFYRNSVDEQQTGLGLNAQMGTVWGFWLSEPKNCVVKNCTVYLNADGLALASAEKGGSNLIEECVAYSNGSSFGSNGGNILVFYPSNDIIRNCHSYRGEGEALALYSDSWTTPGVVENCVAWGSYINLKTRNIANKKVHLGKVRNTIGLGTVHTPNIENSLIHNSNNQFRWDMKTPEDTIVLAEEKDLDQAAEFADPENFDFHLQATSRFRGKGPNGSDRGPFPYQPNIFYLSPDGNDDADGLSMKNAWKTLARAAKNLKAGDTLYLSGGTYEANLKLAVPGSETKQLSIRGRGTDIVVIKGSLQIVGCGNLSLERLQFAGEVDAAKSRNVAFSDCVFGGEPFGLKAKEVGGLKISHSLFANTKTATLWLGEGCSKVFLRGNIHDNRSTPAVVANKAEAILYSDYNSYAVPDRAWRIGKQTTALPKLNGKQDVYSAALKPDLVQEGEAVKLANKAAFAGRGPLGTALGPYRPSSGDELRTVGPTVHSVSATTANLEWKTSGPSTCKVAWGPTPECANEEMVDAAGFGTFSLTGLAPATKYYFRIQSIATPNSPDFREKAKSVGVNTEAISFTTAAADRAPQVYYVSTNGNDGNSGLNRENAWRTIGHAADQVNAGDTVMIAEGTYPGQVRMRATGTKAAPIRFQAIPGETAVLTGMKKNFETVLVIHKKSHVQVDGLRFAEVGLEVSHEDKWPCVRAAAIRVWGGDSIQITRCFFEGRGGADYSPAFVAAYGAENLLIQNCVILNAMGGGVIVVKSPEFRLEHNVFLRNLTGNLTITNRPHQMAHVKNNIFTDLIAAKNTAPITNIARHKSMIEGNNCYVLRAPREKRRVFAVYNESAYERARDAYAVEVDPPGSHPVVKDLLLLTLDEYNRDIAPTNSIAADPNFSVWRRIAADKQPNARQFPVDILMGISTLDFPDLFATNPEVLKRQMGLQPEAFKDYQEARARRERASKQ